MKVGELAVIVLTLALVSAALASLAPAGRIKIALISLTVTLSLMVIIAIAEALTHSPMPSSYAAMKIHKKALPVAMDSHDINTRGPTLS
ncbi:hypothetical protein [Actinoplanes palleronii]|uniref:Uncharacterized protein n=1 Tax=Actinoplanes palleronii TaxID=113570 RepID=A0ABQ4BFJ8_9ACTN|nr:hypothetical protein [Actinoplanes palleronii]GIE69455.1 hypothetical protein Apa02nite_055630 [Actinoplanes palleronii]